MKQNRLFFLWGGLYVLCAGLGFLPEPEGMARTLLTLISLLFFLPPAVILYRGNREERKLVRNLSALSLGLTLAALLGNLWAALGSETLGRALHIVLGILSTPMFLSQIWVLSLFLWACLLMASLSLLKKSRR